MGDDKAALELYVEKGTIEIEALTYIRGRSISNAYILIDEAQNLSAHEIKTIITRVGENTKIVFTGDIDQIDNVYVDATSNGLSYVVEKMKDQEVAGHITLKKGDAIEPITNRRPLPVQGSFSRRTFFVAKKFGQDRLHRLSPNTVPGGVRMDAVVHQLFFREAVLTGEFLGQIQESDVVLLVQTGYPLVYILYHGKEFLLRPRQNRQKDNMRFGTFFVYGFANGGYSFGDFLRGVLAGVLRSLEVVGANQEDRDLRRYAVELAMGNTPQDVLSPIPAESKIQGLAVAVILLPDLRATHYPRMWLPSEDMSNGVADKNNLRVLPLLDQFFDGVVPLIPVVEIVFQF